MFNRGNYSFTNKYLFPPVVPNSIPAFLGKGEYKIFFKKSVANFAQIINNQKDFDKFNQVHIAINSLETNRNSINTEKYKTGFICIPLSSESLDMPLVVPKPNNVYRVYERDPKTPYCIVLDGLGDTFTELDKLYKVQIRLGNWTDINGKIKIPDTLEQLREMERDNSTTSEWSSVTVMKPISEPDFGVYKFMTEEQLKEDSSVPVEKKYNTVGTANFEYVGYYNTVYDTYEDGGYKTFAGTERLVEYNFKLYDSTGKKLLSDSGPINLTEHERKNISHTFNYLTQDQEKYIVRFSIKTENGYEDTKTFPIKADYIVLEMSNAMVRVSEERAYARMKLQVQAKQVVLEPMLKPGATEEMSKLAFVKDEGDPMYSEITEAEQSKIKSTHAMIEGTLEASKSFYLSCPRDIWFLETKIMGLTPFETRELALEKPYIYLENEHLAEQNIPYLTKVKFIVYKKIVHGLGVTTEIVTDPKTGIKSLKRVNNDKETYVFEAIKSSYKRVRGVDVKIAEQTVKKESVTPKEYKWSERVGIATPDGIQDTLQEFKIESRWQYKDITSLDFLYPKTEDGSRLKTPFESDPVIKDTTRKAFVINAPKPINPCQEYYLYITNYMGGFGMEIMEEKIYKPNPNNPLEIIATDYVTENPVLKKFLETKTIQEE